MQTEFLQYNSSRRLPSRLFSTTRRIFASSPGSGTTVYPSSVPVSTTSGLANAAEKNVMLQRRLAEFATIIGDYKIAVNIWDILRKDSHGFHGSVSIDEVITSFTDQVYRMCCLYYFRRHQYQKYTYTMH